MTCSICPNWCRAKWGGRQPLTLKFDANRVPQVRRCPLCGYEQKLTLKEKIVELIYCADWYFGVPDGCEVDEYCMEDEDEIINRILAVCGR